MDDISAELEVKNTNRIILTYTRQRRDHLLRVTEDRLARAAQKIKPLIEDRWARLIIFLYLLLSLSFNRILNIWYINELQTYNSNYNY